MNFFLGGGYFGYTPLNTSGDTSRSKNGGSTPNPLLEISLTLRSLKAAIFNPFIPPLGNYYPPLVKLSNSLFCILIWTSSEPSFTDRGILVIDGVAKATQQGDAEFVYHAKDSDFRSGSGTGLLIENMGRDKYANAWIRKGLEVRLRKGFWFLQIQQC